ncbi:MAG: hypothetical protein Q9218_007758, partial [Villophora microphyllina]
MSFDFILGLVTGIILGAVASIKVLVFPLLYGSPATTMVLKPSNTIYVLPPVSTMSETPINFSSVNDTSLDFTASMAGDVALIFFTIITLLAACRYFITWPIVLASRARQQKLSAAAAANPSTGLIGDPTTIEQMHEKLGAVIQQLAQDLTTSTESARRYRQLMILEKGKADRLGNQIQDLR